MLAKSIFEQKLKCEHLVRCQKIHICCVDKANIWWDDKKWFYQEMWKEIYLMCQQNICRDHKDIYCVNTQQRMGNRHQLDVSLVWWRHDHCTKICKIPKISNVSLHKSPKSSRSPFLSLGSSFCGLKTRISLHLVSCPTRLSSIQYFKIPRTEKYGMRCASLTVIFFLNSELEKRLKLV